MSRNEKKLIKEAIVLAVSELKDDIFADADANANKTRAEAIRTLTEAFKNVK